MKTIAVLGAGMVGRAIAIDLARHYSVTSFDISRNRLESIRREKPELSIQVADISDYSSYPILLEGFDLVITAVPGFLGYRTLEGVIKAGKNAVDISFFPEDALQLDAMAKEKGVTVITDCGVAPGMSNFIIGHYNKQMKISSVECYVGGLPAHRTMPWQYKAPFSPVDVIQEYIRPARLVEGGHIVTKPALSDREMIDFGEVGSLEAFNTDGLRSLLFTMSHIPDMKEKTLRYPGHIDLILALQQSGFFETEAVIIEGCPISPLEFTSRILIDQWKLEPDEEEFTVMRVTLHGESKTVEYNLLDRYDEATRTSSMARTTGYTCNAAANLVLQGLFNEKGVFPPELVGEDASCFEFVLKYLEDRSVYWRKKEY